VSSIFLKRTSFSIIFVKQTSTNMVEQSYWVTRYFWKFNIS